VGKLGISPLNSVRTITYIGSATSLFSYIILKGREFKNKADEYNK
jgi:hypothetical protein